MYYHKLFNSKKFERATNDGFFISIDESDQKFDRNTTVSWLKEIGAGNIELVEDE